MSLVKRALGSDKSDEQLLPNQKTKHGVVPRPERISPGDRRVVSGRPHAEAKNQEPRKSRHIKYI